MKMNREIFDNFNNIVILWLENILFLGDPNCSMILNSLHLVHPLCLPSGVL